MKKINLLALLFLTACTYTKQQKAEKLVTAYLDTTLNDPHSYEGIGFGKLDTLVSIAEGDPQYAKMSYTLDSLKEIQKSLSDRIDMTNSSKELHQIMRKNNELYLAEKNVINKQLFFSLHYKGKPIGWIISHKYRAKNGFGALGLHESNFGIDSNLTKVVYAKDKSN